MALKLKKKSIRRYLDLAVVTDPAKSAQQAGLRYICDDRPGIQRKRAGRGFTYVDADGDRITDAKILERIKALVIPPAWENVWICPFTNGHLQATGYDAKGRKQYRYHADWSKVRSQTKFNRMIAFGLALPKIREVTEAHLRKRSLSREKVLATVVRLLEETTIRIGNEEYAAKNRSFGLTTLRTRHVKIVGKKVQFRFRGKRGIQHEIELSDRRLAKIVKSCRDIPGHELFQYFNEEGDRQTIDSGDVNDYLQEITGEDFTAKDFRTWVGTIQVALELEAMGEPTSQTAAKRNISQAIKHAAQKLGNRPATCRKYYVHPVILAAYTEGWLLPMLAQRSPQTTAPTDLKPEEKAVLAILQQQLLQDTGDHPSAAAS